MANDVLSDLRLPSQVDPQTGLPPGVPAAQLMPQQPEPTEQEAPPEAPKAHVNVRPEHVIEAFASKYAHPAIAAKHDEVRKALSMRLNQDGQPYVPGETGFKKNGELEDAFAGDEGLNEYAGRVSSAMMKRMKEMGFHEKESEKHRKALEDELKARIRGHVVSGLANQLASQSIYTNGQRRTGDVTQRDLVSALPFGGDALSAEEAAADRRMAKGEATQRDYMTLAAKMASAKAAGERNLGQNIAFGGLKLPGQIAEFEMTGGVNALSASPARLLQIGAKVAGETAPQAELDENGRLTFKSGEDFSKALYHNAIGDALERGVIGMTGGRFQHDNAKYILSQIGHMFWQGELSQEVKHLLGAAPEGSALHKYSMAKNDDERHRAAEEILSSVGTAGLFHGAMRLHDKAQRVGQNYATKQQVKDFMAKEVLPQAIERSRMERMKDVNTGGPNQIAPEMRAAQSRVADISEHMGQPEQGRPETNRPASESETDIGREDLRGGSPRSPEVEAMRREAGLDTGTNAHTPENSGTGPGVPPGLEESPSAAEMQDFARAAEFKHQIGFQDRSKGMSVGDVYRRMRSIGFNHEKARDLALQNRPDMRSERAKEPEFDAMAYYEELTGKGMSHDRAKKMVQARLEAMRGEVQATPEQPSSAPESPQPRPEPQPQERPSSGVQASPERPGGPQNRPESLSSIRRDYNEVLDEANLKPHERKVMDLALGHDRPTLQQLAEHPEVLAAAKRAPGRDFRKQGIAKIINRSIAKIRERFPDMDVEELRKSLPTEDAKGVAKAEAVQGDAGKRETVAPSELHGDQDKPVIFRSKESDSDIAQDKVLRELERQRQKEAHDKGVQASEQQAIRSKESVEDVKAASRASKEAAQKEALADDTRGENAGVPPGGPGAAQAGPGNAPQPPGQSGQPGALKEKAVAKAAKALKPYLTEEGVRELDWSHGKNQTLEQILADMPWMSDKGKEAVKKYLDAKDKLRDWQHTPPEERPEAAPEAPGAKPLSPEEQVKVGGGQEDAEPMPGAERRTERNLTALYNEKADEERVANGLEPLMSQARQANREVWDKAMAQLNADPKAADKLIEKLTKKPEPVNTEEAALMLWQKINLRNQYSRAANDWLKADAAFKQLKAGWKLKADLAGLEGVSLEDVDRRYQESEALLKQIDHLDKLTRDTGSEAGRAFQFRKQLAADDYSLAGMLQKAKMAKGRDLTPEEKKQIAALQAEIADLHKKLEEARKAAEGKPPTAPEHAEVDKVEGELATTLKKKWKAPLTLDKQLREPLTKQFMDLWDKIRRAFVLSGLTVFEKLGGAAGFRMATRPMEEASGSFWRQMPVFARIAAMSAKEGRGLRPVNEVKVAYSAMTKGLNDSLQTLLHGGSELEAKHGETKHYESEHMGVADIPGHIKKVWKTDAGKTAKVINTITPFLDLPGVLHATMKAPVKRAGYTRAYLNLIDQYTERGLDPMTPENKAKIGVEAYKHGQRDIFMQDNVIASEITNLENRWKNSDDPLGRAAGITARTLTPIKRVPTNIVLEAMENIAGVPLGTLRAGFHYAKGIDKMTEAQADGVMRQLKKGSYGAAALLIGAYAWQNMGGVYTEDERRKKKGDVPAGDIRVGGKDIPHQLLHHPLVETAQVGAAAMRDSKIKVHGVEQGKVAGATEALMGLASEVPFARTAKDVGKMLSAEDRGYHFGEFVKSLAVPQLLEWIAKQGDKAENGEPIKRQPHDVVEHVKMGVPGLRQQVKAKGQKATSR